MAAAPWSAPRFHREAFVGFRCPLSNEIMVDPVMTSDGFSYERLNIERHLDQERAQGMVVFWRSPITNAVLTDSNLYPNIALRSVIEEWLEQQPQKQKKPANTREPSPENALKFPTLAVGALYSARKQLKTQFKIDIDIEPDTEATDLGSRLVTLRPLHPDAAVGQLETEIWTLCQKQCWGRNLVLNENGLPYTQLIFDICAANYKIGRLLQKKEKHALEKQFRVNFLVERPRPGQETRAVVITAWNATHADRVDATLQECQDYILSMLDE